MIYNSSGEKIQLTATDFSTKKIGVIGDSITDGARVSYPDKNFVELLGTVFAKSYNYGVSATLLSGSGTSAMCNRYTGMRDDLDIVVVFGGTNDWYTGAPLGTATDADNATFYGALNVMIPGLLSKYPEGDIIFITPMNSAYGGKNTDNQNSAGATMKQYVDAIKERCSYHGIPVLDLFEKSGMDIAHVTANGTTWAHWTADGVHPNANGHKRIFDRLLGFLIEIEGRGAAL